MRYLLVRWNHSSDSYPVLLYSELDEERNEVRKVEVYRDGRKGYASREGASGGTRLGQEPLPPLAEIAAESEFEPAEVTPEEFERVWAERET